MWIILSVKWNWIIFIFKISNTAAPTMTYTICKFTIIASKHGKYCRWSSGNKKEKQMYQTRSRLYVYICSHCQNIDENSYGINKNTINTIKYNCTRSSFKTLLNKEIVYKIICATIDQHKRTELKKYLFKQHVDHQQNQTREYLSLFVKHIFTIFHLHINW